MKQILTLLSFLLFWFPSLSQTEVYQTFLEKNSIPIDINNTKFQFDNSFYNNQLFFFGFVHGSQTPQLLDFELLKHLSKHGVRYYAPEVDYSMAYFFNRYLATGDEKTLDYLCFYYKNMAPQDASIQFKNKWQKIYNYNKTLKQKDKITILGFDHNYFSTELIITHIAFLAPNEETGISYIDSLKYFKNFDKDTLDVISEKPIYKSMKPKDYFFETDKTIFYKHFIAEYKKDSSLILKKFKENASALRYLINQSNGYDREKIIFLNFKKIGLPLIKKGEKIYANYGYYHIQQEKISGNSPFAKIVKDNCDIKIVSLVGILTNSECLNYRKIKPVKTIVLKSVKFKQAEYNGYTTSKTLDGNSFFKRINGIGLLKKLSKGTDVKLFTLIGKDSPFKDNMIFADFSRGGKNWKVEKNKGATDYFQYIFLIKNSKANIPLEEE